MSWANANTRRTLLPPHAPSTASPDYDHYTMQSTMAPTAGVSVLEQQHPLATERLPPDAQ